MKSNRLPAKKKKVQITPAQQMLNRFEALQRAASSSSSSNAGVKRSSITDSSSAVKQLAGLAVQKVSNAAAAPNGSQVPCATKPKLGDRVAHKPKLVRVTNMLCVSFIRINNLEISTYLHVHR